jgi:hypothetical protein
LFASTATGGAVCGADVFRLGSAIQITTAAALAAAIGISHRIDRRCHQGCTAGDATGSVRANAASHA